MMMKPFKISIIFILALFLIRNIQVYGENFKVQISPLKDKIYLGEQVEFKIEILSDSNILDISSDLKEKLKKFEVSKVNKEIKHNRAVYRFYLQFFNLGKIVIPEINFNIRINKDEVKIKTNKLILNILSNIKEKDNSTVLRPVKPPQSVGFYLTTNELIILTGILLLILIILFLIFRYIKKKNQVEEIKHILSPLEEFKNFETIALELISNGKIRDFYFGVSEASRNYLDRIFDIQTLEATIKEIEDIFSKIDLDDNLKRDLLLLFKAWEFFKFTDNFPDKDRALKDLEAVSKIIYRIESENV